MKICRHKISIILPSLQTCLRPSVEENFVIGCIFRAKWCENGGVGCGDVVVSLPVTSGAVRPKPQTITESSPMHASLLDNHARPKDHIGCGIGVRCQVSAVCIVEGFDSVRVSDVEGAWQQRP